MEYRLCSKNAEELSVLIGELKDNVKLKAEE